MSTTLISIAELYGKQFFIPSYQRGYRWSKLQVETLLQDIHDFKPDGSGHDFYCLQPLVVACDSANENVFRVVDGQQRLTTIYLILKVLKKSSFTLKFERETLIDDFLRNEINDSTIDAHFLSAAYQTISDWMNDKTFNEEKFLNRVKFIWYEIDNRKEEEYFRNLNTGKIPLTNAELIKGLFLGNTGEGTLGEINQAFIAEEFDAMERRLRNPEFWYFLAGRESQRSSCLDLVFELLYGKSTLENPYKTFNEAEAKIKESHEAAWGEIRKCFHTLEAWFEDPYYFHLVGFLRGCKTPLDLKKDIYDQALGNTKTEFKGYLKKQCRKLIGLPENTANLDFDQYGDKGAPKTRNLLLLLNIASYVNGIKEKKIHSKGHFSFAAYHQENWEVEHISPQTPSPLKST